MLILHRRRFIAVIISVALSAAALALLIVESRTSAQPLAPRAVALMSTTQSPPPVTVTPSLVRSTLIRLRLDPSDLAAAGVAPGSVATVVTNAADALSASATALSAADLDIGQLTQNVASLERDVQGGTFGEGDVTALSDARSQLATAKANRQSVLDGLHTSAVASLSSEQRSRLQTLRTNSDWEVSPAYCVGERTEAQFVNLREALAHERHALANDLEIDDEVATLLAQVRSEQAVALALSNTTTNLSAIAIAWNDAID